MTTRHVKTLPSQFRFEAQLGEGGTASVFKVTHARYAEPIALKLLDDVSDPKLRGTFWQEVQALARLRHPHIIDVIDMGIDGDQPWLAMQFADGGALSESSFDSWDEFEWNLRRILHGLAHAHSRGIVHRDIKPGNIVVVRGMPRLTDFGIAHIHEPHVDLTDTVNVTGTPAFMAPEQFESAWRRFSPATDIYCLGAVCWLWTTGRPVFDEHNFFALMFHHANEEPPEFEPRFEVPVGFEGWLRRCLAKAQTDRFEFAADALAALDELDLTRVRESTGKDAEMFAQKTEVSEEPTMVRNRGHAPAHEFSSEFGLSLFGLREPPFVGRREELALLEGALRDGKRWVSVEGPPACGKSSLIQEFAHSCHQTGTAHVVPLEGLGRSTLDVLSAALDYYLVSHGLDVEEARRHIAGRLEALDFREEEASRLVERLVSIVCSGQSQPIQTTDALRAFVSFFAAVAARRPVVFMVDDAHRSGDALLTIRKLIEADDPFLVVTTIDLDELQERPAERWRIQKLVDEHRPEKIELEKLGEKDLRRVVREWLPIEDDGLQKLLDFADRSALVLNHTLLDWVRRGALERQRQHFVVREVDGLVPTASNRLWLRRIEDILEAGHAHVREVVWAAALLGYTFSGADWVRLAARVGAVVDPDLIAALQNDGIIVSVERSKVQNRRFGHELIREAILEDLKTRGRLDELHQEAAAYFEEQQAHFRAATHWHAIGEHERAFELAIESIDHAFVSGDSDGMKGMVEWVKSWLDPDDLERVLTLGVWDISATQKVAPDQLDEICDRYVEIARSHTDAHLVRMLAQKALVTHWRDPEPAKIALDEAARLVSGVDDREVLRGYNETAGRIRLYQERPELAQRHLEMALKLTRADEQWHRLSIHVDMVSVRLELEDYEGAIALAREAIGLAERVGDLYLEAYVRSEGAEALVQQGQFEEARVWLTRSLVIFDEIRAYNRDFVVLALSLLELLHFDDLEAAREVFKKVTREHLSGEYLRREAMVEMALAVATPDKSSLVAFEEFEAHAMASPLAPWYAEVGKLIEIRDLATRLGKDELAARLTEFIDGLK